MRKIHPLSGSAIDRPPLLAGVLLLAFTTGCANRAHNTVAYLPPDVTGHDFGLVRIDMRHFFFYPARDILTLDWLWRGDADNPAWNADLDFSRGTSFYEERAPAELSPDSLRAGPPSDPPRPPFRVTAAKGGLGSAGFIGRDAAGRKFLFKLDDPNYPELGSGAAAIAARLYWALGYRVPAVHIVTIEGTGEPRHDGRRAAVSEFLEKKGLWEFDWFRYRREVRALRMAAAWMNDVDRGGQNNLLVDGGDRTLCYLVDFDSCLGAWQGRPKEPWRGHRHWGDLGWRTVTILTLGRLQAAPDPNQPVVSPAVGRFTAEHFDPIAWKPEAPNTAFDHMTVEDLRWIAERLRRLDRPQLEAIVAAAEFSSARDAEYIVQVLLARRARILELAGAAAQPPSRRLLPE